MATESTLGLSDDPVASSTASLQKDVHSMSKILHCYSQRSIDLMQSLSIYVLQLHHMHYKSWCFGPAFSPNIACMQVLLFCIVCVFFNSHDTNSLCPNHVWLRHTEDAMEIVP